VAKLCPITGQRVLPVCRLDLGEVSQTFVGIVSLLDYSLNIIYHLCVSDWSRHYSTHRKLTEMMQTGQEIINYHAILLAGSFYLQNISPFTDASHSALMFCCRTTNAGTFSVIFAGL